MGGALNRQIESLQNNVSKYGSPYSGFILTAVDLKRLCTQPRPASRHMTCTAHENCGIRHHPQGCPKAIFSPNFCHLVMLSLVVVVSHYGLRTIAKSGSPLPHAGTAVEATLAGLCVALTTVLTSP